MVKKIKRGLKGSAAQYLTRARALKKLQLKLPQFRRLCILKGIHPREPKKKPNGLNKTYYHVKDVNFLLHEPLLNQFRDDVAFDKKLKKARAKKNSDLLERLMKRRPTHRLDHLVKERYPSFIDALRDIDDALTLVFLFATLPAEKAHKLPQKQLEVCRKLSLEWQAFVVRSHALRKVFVTVRGYYYQAEVMGQTITWMTPHSVGQVLATDVDYRVMLTFLEFYVVLLRFVHFKLYHSLGLKYPPGLTPEMEETAAGLEAVVMSLANSDGGKPAQIAGPETTGKQQAEEEVEEEMDEEENDEEDDEEEEEGGSADSEEDEEDEEDDDDEDDEDEEEASDEMQPIFAPVGAQEDEETGSKASALVGGAADAIDDASVCEKLFKGMCFFLGREVPREPLMLVIRAFGGTVVWDGEGSALDEGSEEITHQVVDRPVQGHRFLSREYVQPQWVFDSTNFRVLAPCKDYAPGASLPPHLSPFDTPDDYEPEWQKTMSQLKDAATNARLRQGDASGADLEEEALVAEEAAPGVPANDGRAQEAAYQAELKKELNESAAAEDAEEGEEEEDAPSKPLKSKDATEADEMRMKTSMMSKKAKRLYEKINQSKAYKAANVEKLREKRAALEAKRQKTTKL